MQCLSVALTEAEGKVTKGTLAPGNINILQVCVGSILRVLESTMMMNVVAGGLTGGDGGPSLTVDNLF